MLRRVSGVPIALFALIFADVEARAQAVSSIDIVEYGLYVADVENTEVLPNGLAANTLSSLCHVATTYNVPAKMGMHFGFRFRTNGPNNGIVGPRKIIVFPADMRPPGSPPLKTAEFQISKLIGSVSYTGYAFDHAWEMQLGTWTTQIWEGNRKLAEMNFTVVDSGDPSVPPFGDSRCFQFSRL